VQFARLVVNSGAQQLQVSFMQVLSDLPLVFHRVDTANPKASF
jgi:hypothetical protein